MTAADVLLLALGAVAVGAGLLVVTTRHLVRAGLYLVLCLAAVAGMFLVLTAEVVAWVQVLIYVGAVVVLLLFAVMLTRAPTGASADLDRPIWPGLLVGGGTAAGLAGLFVAAYRWTAVEFGAPGSAGVLGAEIFGNWVLAFELLSVLLLAALVGAIIISRPDVGATSPAADDVPGGR